MTIQFLVVVGAIVGLLSAILIRNARLGCASLWVIPVAMIIVVIVDQQLHRENVRSTSALDFIFAPLWPSLGALVGYAAGRLTQSAIKHVRNRNGS